MQKLLSLKIILKKLQIFDLSYFRGKNYFVEDGTKNYLVFPPIFRYFKTNLISSVTSYVLSWKSKGLSGETIKAPSTSDNSLTPSINCINNTGKIRVKFTVYELSASSSSDSDPTLNLFIWHSYFNKKHRYRKIWTFWLWNWI